MNQIKNSVQEDDAELDELLGSRSDAPTRGISKEGGDCDASPSRGSIALSGGDSLRALTQYTQWARRGSMWIPTTATVQTIQPGVYEIHSDSNIGIFFSEIPIKTEGLLRFPQSSSDLVIEEIQHFWERDLVFREFGLPHKRGILIWGPPGSEKSSTIQLLVKDIVERSGIVVKFTHPELFSAGIRALREIAPDLPVLVLMEDLDSTLQQYSETAVLNILDGIDRVEKMVFLATTNYPELLGPRIVNRPSRFDKRIKIGHPNAESREIYLTYMVGPREIPQVDLQQWVRDTEGFSLAHLKELFVAVVILDADYGETLQRLSRMKDKITSANDTSDRAGLRGGSWNHT